MCTADIFVETDAATRCCQRDFTCTLYEHPVVFTQCTSQLHSQQWHGIAMSGTPSHRRSNGRDVHSIIMTQSAPKTALWTRVPPPAAHDRAIRRSQRDVSTTRTKTLLHEQRPENRYLPITSLDLACPLRSSSLLSTTTRCPLKYGRGGGWCPTIAHSDVTRWQIGMRCSATGCMSPRSTESTR